MPDVEQIAREALRIADESDQLCPFFKSPYPPADKPCSVCGQNSNCEGGMCVRDHAHHAAISHLRQHLIEKGE